MKTSLLQLSLEPLRSSFGRSKSTVMRDCRHKLCWVKLSDFSFSSCQGVGSRRKARRLNKLKVHWNKPLSTPTPFLSIGMRCCCASHPTQNCCRPSGNEWTGDAHPATTKQRKVGTLTPRLVKDDWVSHHRVTSPCHLSACLLLVIHLQCGDLYWLI